MPDAIHPPSPASQPSSTANERGWGARFDLSHVAAAWESSSRLGLREPLDTAVVFYDLDLLDEQLDALKRAFPPDTLHAIAIKANAYVAILERVVAHGMGLEAASIEEVAVATAAGCLGPRIVFDSPAKTDAELVRALRDGHVVNLDGFEELARVDALIRGGVTVSPTSHVGLRVNSAVGAGTIAATSVSARSSKFGVSIDDGEAIHRAFADHPWLDGLHVHGGSQGSAIVQLTMGIARVDELRRDIDARAGRRRVRVFDIGGGLPTTYDPAKPAPSIDAYATLLRQEVPALFDGGLTLVTEFGRAVHAGNAVVVSRIETVKHVAGRETLVVHVGADMFLRRVYAPKDWDHEMEVLDAEGRRRPPDAPRGPVDVVGPLCFAGDVLARDRTLPQAARGDLLVLRDVGAYTSSMWSRHCSRAMPAVLGIRDAGRHVEMIREREREADIVALWSRSR